MIITAYQRPDFLHATLARLKAADDPDVQYWICLDRRHSGEVSGVASRFITALAKRARVQTPPHHAYRGNSFNTLTAYRRAVESGADLIHLVEEDVFVGVDYFTAHRAAHALCPDVFAVSLCRNQLFLAGHDPEPDDEAVWQHPGYQSIGVSFRPARLAAAMVHAVPAYFANPIGYCRDAFPATTIPVGNAEQDGLLGRVAEAHSWQTAYTAVPRAYHAGFYGAHRNGQRLSGTVEQRSRQLLAMGAHELNAHAHSFPDHTTVALDAVRAPLSKVITWP